MTRARKFWPVPAHARLDADILLLWDAGLSVDEIAVTLRVDEMRVAAIVAEIDTPGAFDASRDLVA